MTTLLCRSRDGLARSARHLRASARRALLITTSIGLVLGTALVAPVPVAQANTSPVASFEVLTGTCPTTLFWQPRMTSVPGVSWTGDFIVTLKGDTTTSATRVIKKGPEGLAPWETTIVHRGYDTLAMDDAPFTGVDWAALGANPRIEVTWTYIITTTSAGPVLAGTPFVIPVTPWTAPTLTSGDGTAADPFLVSTPAQVNEMRCHAGTVTHFKLTNDIELAGVDFLPLGHGTTSQFPMRGMIDGAGHTIKNLNINLPQSSRVGFVGVAYGLLIRKLTFTDPILRNLGDDTSNFRTGVVVAFGHNLVTLTEVNVTRAKIYGRSYIGLLIGYTEKTSVVRSRAEGEIFVSPQPYVGDPARLATDVRTSKSEIHNVAGFVGYLWQGEILGSHLNVTITGNADRIRRVAGFIGWPRKEIRVSNVDANVDIDLVVRRTGPNTDSSSGVFGGDSEEFGPYLSNSRINVDMTLTAPSTAEQVNFQNVAGIHGHPRAAGIYRTSVTGSLTLDARAATGDVVITENGGGFGRINSTDAAFISESHLDVDVTIFTKPGGIVSRVGALAGSTASGRFNDLRVDGSVAITGDAEEVAGLIGHTEEASGMRVTNRVESVIYRGSVSVSGTTTKVGTLFGNLDQFRPWDGTIAPFAVTVVNTWWDSSRNSQTTADRTLPGAPATAAQLSDLSWLYGKGFSNRVWCVSAGAPVVYPLTSSSCNTGGGGGGSTDGGSVVDRVRIDAADRYGTSAAISRWFFAPGVAIVYLATGASFADALAAGPLAAGSGPVLVVRHGEIPDDIKAELARLQPGRIVVLGGPAAISDAVLAAAGDFTTGGVTRLFGSDRFATAVSISQVAHTGRAAKVYIATGTDFADALSGGPYAAGDGPILLVQPDRIPASTVAELTRLKPEQIIVFGGPDAVSPEVVRSLGKYASQAVLRIHGPDRYATSVAISQAEFEPGVSTLFLATGVNFADALSAGAAAGKSGPVLLVRPDCVPVGVYNEILRLTPKEIFVLGGTAAVGVGVQSLTKCSR